MTGRRYDNVIREVTERPWAILPGTLAAIQELVEARVEGVELSRDEIEERITSSSWSWRRDAARRGGQREGAQRVASSRGGAVAVLPVAGVIIPKATMFSDISGGTSVQGFREEFLSAMGDRDVGAVVLDIDSPGGQSALLPELARSMRDARGAKPVLAVANTLAASAAYWIASQADEVAVTPSGLAGSIGVFATHQDLSKAQENLGIKTTLISAGRYKTDGNPHQPLSEDAAAHLQSLVDDAYASFVSDVSKGRRVPVSDVRGGFGEGRVLTAADSVSEGLADRVETLEQTIGRAASMVAGAGPGGNSASAFFPSRDVTLVVQDPAAAASVDWTDLQRLVEDAGGHLRITTSDHANSSAPELDADESLTDRLDALILSADEILTVAARFPRLSTVKRDRLATFQTRIAAMLDRDERDEELDEAEELSAEDELAFTLATVHRSEKE